MGSIKAAVGKKRKRLISWFKDEPIGGPQVESELTGTIASKRMATPRHASHVGKRVHRPQRRQAALEPLPLGPAPLSLLLARAKLSELGVGEFDYDGSAPNSINGIC